ncbi:uncharacterized protein LOC120166633 [Hibiscus syriacus]|uniref:uncharacterized protein LOC120166633 n=1 Tax=Hibiscus syriacus TaxID=106335 RepID=UPI0019229F75|nr:uncharacterized protein LOC120166633 [Hibiscus syriacus]
MRPCFSLGIHLNSQTNFSATFLESPSTMMRMKPKSFANSSACSTATSSATKELRFFGCWSPLFAQENSRNWLLIRLSHSSKLRCWCWSGQRYCKFCQTLFACMQSLTT